jgi:ubiquinone/menaquinone biosynthesis C-methylase UbiE
MAQARKPGRGDVSRADRTANYAYKKRFYQSSEVASDYDFHRFGSPERQRRNAAKWKTIRRALARAGGTDAIRTILDLPCGTGRFTGHLGRDGYDVIGSDIAIEMMQVAAKQLAGTPRLHGYVRADAENLPLADNAIDCVMSIRFLLHIDPATRISIIREMARVSTKWLILDYRHKHSYRYMTLRLRQMLGVPSARKLPQVSRAEMTRELEAAGVRVAKIFPVASFFSDKWVVLCEKTVPA